jgi:hypothetical protein
MKIKRAKTIKKEKKKRKELKGSQRRVENGDGKAREEGGGVQTDETT